MSEKSTNGFVIEDGALKSYTLRDAVVIIPDGVKTIDTAAFKGCASIEEVVLPETITHIMDDAFKGCRKLKKINFPSKLIYIGEYAFHRCHSLLSVELPVTVKSLEACAFLYCDSLEHVSIPGVTQLGRQTFVNDINIQRLEVSSDLDLSCICEVFTGCGKISSIRLFDGVEYNIKSLIQVMSSKSNIHPLVKTIAIDIYKMMEIRDGILVKLLINLKDVEIPDGIIDIAKSCFFDKKGLVTIKLPATLKHIGSRAFRNCINLETVYFTNEDVIISQDAFKNCTTLKNIILSDGRKYELKGLPDTKDKSIPAIVCTIHSQILNNFFISGTTLIQYRGHEERVVVPDGITIIDERAFARNQTVGRIILPDSVREIHEEAFADCILLQTISINEGLELLGKSAFENCVKLIRAELPESLTTLEKSTFNRCRKLNEIKFGSNIKEIGDLAFYLCNSLKLVDLPEKLISIGDMAFYKCLSLKEITLPKSLRKLGNNVFTASGIKTAEICCNLVECGTDIFSQCNKLSSLTFHEGVQSITDKFAFRCTSLKNVNLPSSIEYIGRDAFEDSIYLIELRQIESFPNVIVNKIFLDGSELTGDIIIPDGVTTIAGGAFYGNTNITSVSFPESLRRIGSRSFCGCTSLKSISLHKHVSILEEGVFAYCTSLERVTSEGEITHVSDNAFYRCSKITVAPSSQAQYIGNYAFYGCEQLETLKTNCSTIQADAFRKTAFLDNLKSTSPLVIISDIVVDGSNCKGCISIPEAIKSIAPYAFAGNDLITDIQFPESLISIGDGAFSGCKSIKKANLPKSLKHLGKKAFEKCISITNLSGNVETIGESAFSYCKGLKNAILQGIHILEKEIFCGCAALESCICNELQYIGESCFNGCEMLSDFDFSNIQEIGEYCFYGCNSLKIISLNSDTFVSAHAFEDCGRLQEVILSDNRLRYGSYAFSGCTALKALFIGTTKYSTDNYSVVSDENIPNIAKYIYHSAISCFNIDENLSLFGYTNKGRFIHIPDGIKTIEREVFKDAMNLEEIHVPKSAKYIAERAFHSTKWLENQRAISPMVVVNNILIDASLCKGDVLIPDDIKTVSGWAFANCYALTSVKFSSPKTITEEYAFRNCINLKKVITSDGKEYILNGISDRHNELLPESVKQIFMDCLNCFKTDENNSLIECTGNINNLVIANGITSIGENVFKESNLLTCITLSNDTTYIGTGAFDHCKWLASVKNAFNVERIEKLAFSGCFLLEDIEISEKLQHIGIRAFEHCTSLKSIIIPEGITEIPEKSFYRCKSLKKIILPSTLKSIGKEAFAFCYELAEINFPKALISIDSRAFAWCSKVEVSSIPKGVEVKNDSFSQGDSQ